MAGSYVLIAGLTYGLHGRCYMDRKKEILEMSKDMDWPTAVQNINQVVSLYASRIASEGQFSPEAVKRACEVQAAWERIQRG